MGNRRIFWIRENPIRNYLAAPGDTTTLRNEIRRAILEFSAEGGENLPLATKMFDKPGNHVQVWSLFSNNHGVLAWYGGKLVVAGARPNPAMVEALAALDSMIGGEHEVDAAPNGFLFERPESLDANVPNVEPSIWFIDEDFSRELERTAPNVWSSDPGDASVLIQKRSEKAAGLLAGEWVHVEPYRSAGEEIDVAPFKFALYEWTGRLDRITDGIPAMMPSLLESLGTGHAWVYSWNHARVEVDQVRSLDARSL